MSGAGDVVSESALPRPIWMLIPQQEQRQDSVSDQLSDLHAIAVRCGMYDAADWLAKWMAVDEGVTS